MGAEPGSTSTRPTWWRPALTVAVFSALPFAVFLDDNRAEAQLDATLALYVLAVFAIGLGVVVAADRLRGPEARERAAFAFAVGAYVFFHFQFARDLTDAIGLSRDSAAATLLVWAALFAVTLAVAIRVSRHPAAWNFAAVAGALLLAFPAIAYASYKAESEPAGASEAPVAAATEPDLTPGDGTAGERPDVWYFLLDGYARADVLAETLGYDNSGFLRALERRGFEVDDDALAAYPETFLAQASTLDMRFPATEGELGDHTPYYEAIEGDNETVRAFGELGYEYAFGSDYSSFDCTDAVDLCVLPEADAIDVMIGERERAILGATPLIEALPSLGIHPTTLRGYLSPEEMVADTESGRSGDPVFAYAHILTPHPPYRYLEGCELKTDLRDHSLIDWGEADGDGGEEYARAVECVNEGLLAAVDAIVERDRDAIILIQGDHGPKFGEMNFHRPLSDWTEAELHERFPILSAQRLSSGCEPAGRDAGYPPNAFRQVLGCITGEPVEPLPVRHFMIDLLNERIEAVEEGLSPP